MKAYWGSGGIAPRILNLGARWRWVASFTHWRFTPRETASGTHRIGNWVGPRAGIDTVVKRKNSQPLSGHVPPFIQPVVQRYIYELSRIFNNIFRKLYVDQWSNAEILSDLFCYKDFLYQPFVLLSYVSARSLDFVAFNY
jgi:hypothetical protein